jgi:hypothetical protein
MTTPIILKSSDWILPGASVPFWRRNLRSKIIQFNCDVRVIYKWFADIIEIRADLTDILHDLIRDEFPQYLTKFQQIVMLQ